MIFSREFFFHPHKIYSFIYTRLFENQMVSKWGNKSPKRKRSIGHLRVAFCLRFKTSLGREGGRHFHMNGFARRFIFKRRQKVTRSFCSAPGIETSSRLQHRKSGIHGLIVKSEKSDWLKDTERELCACSC